MAPSSATFPVPDTDRKSAPVIFTPGQRLSVLLPLPINIAYDYRVPQGMEISLGQFVQVPFGRRIELGVVWGEGTGEVKESKLRDVIQVTRNVPLPLVSRNFIDWVSHYTMNSKGLVLRMCIRPARGWQPRNTIKAIVRRKGAIEDIKIRMTPAREKVLVQTQKHVFHGVSALAKAAGVSAGVVRGLIEVGVLTVEKMLPPPMFEPPDPKFGNVQLNNDQATAATHLKSLVGAGYSVVLLEGVTGSGKTEVYFEAVAESLRHGKQVVVLLPEIALTTQWLLRFEARFGVTPAVWHSDVGGRQRRETWHSVGIGEARVVVGARSALFLPFPNLGLIIVDEEHDTAFKQENGVIYNARDMAVVRAREGKIPLVLASATPSLESVVNVETQRYGRVYLPDRHGIATLPSIEAVDLKATPPEKGDWGRSWLAPVLVDAVDSTLNAGEQILLFLNRRGYAPLTLCSTCGHRLQCPQCTAWLVEHRLTQRLQCHHCGYTVTIPLQCPGCEDTGTFVPCGPGVERVAEEVLSRWPSARVAAITSDTLDRPSSVHDLIERIVNNRLDILIGTQILAKGHNFPSLTLVGVVDADLGLSSWDLRASERTYQLLCQVAGRAGRADRPGRVLLQTHDMRHPVITALLSGDVEQFLAAERSSREALNMPPFGRLAAIILSGRDEMAVAAVGQSLAQAAPQIGGLEVLGPAPALLSMLRGRHRKRFLLKGKPSIRLQPVISAWLKRVKVPSSVRLQVDIDPYSFY